MPVAASVIRRHGPFVTSVVRQMEPRAFRPIKPLVEVDAFACDEGEGDGTQAWCSMPSVVVAPNSRAGDTSSTPGRKVCRTIGHPKVLPQRQHAAHVRLDSLLTLCPYY
jgi:hypothetical protein